MTLPIATANTYTDLQGLAQLRTQARQNTPDSIRAVARQFEALFMQMMIKEMRNASLSDGLFDNDQSRLYQELYDKQISLNLTQGRGIGLADMMVRQLGGKDDATATAARLSGLPFTLPRPVVATPISVPPLSAITPAPATTNAGFATPAAFISALWPEAQTAGRTLGVAPEVLLAQAALETGWGKNLVRDAQGGNTHNLFNIKADAGWSGARASTQTLEFQGGQWTSQPAAFRAYDSYAQSFNDYVALLRDNPRYAPALKAAPNPAAFVNALQQAGYATDPAYASKVQAIMRSAPFQATQAQLKPGVGQPLTQGHL